MTWTALTGLPALERIAPGELHTEAWRPGAGWVEDAGAADVYRNGQDYDLLTAAEAEALVAELE